MHNLNRFYKHILLLLGLFICSDVDAQSFMYQEDPLLDSCYCSIKNNFNAYLIQEDSTYNFKICNIYHLDNGYLIMAKTQINDSLSAIVHIVSPKSSSLGSQRIKIGNNYLLKLKRYFSLPVCAGLEVRFVDDVMLGNKTIRINQTGGYSYLFTSLNINGLYVNSKDMQYQVEHTLSTDSLQLRHSIETFLKYISTGKQEDDLYALLDTNQILKSLKQYGAYWSLSFNLKDYSKWMRSEYPKKQHYNWLIDQNPPKYDWQNDYPWNNPKPNQNCFREMFTSMLRRDYQLPISTDSDLDYSLNYTSIQYKTLYYSEPETFTLHIIWTINNIDKHFAAVINVEKSGDTYLITGFNKAYSRYHLSNVWNRPIPK